MTIPQVSLSDTYDVWRIRTNQIIVKLESLEGNTTNSLSNTYSKFGGNITGDMVITGNVTISGTLDLL